jgi:hypothetical protein
MAVIVFDYFAVLIAAVVCFLFGWAWHSPYLFGNMMKNDKKKKDKKMTAWPFIGHFITLLITAWVLSMVIVNIGIATFEGVLLMVVLVWFGFYATTSLGTVLWGDEPTVNYIIRIVYHLINLGIMSLILFFL